MAKRKKARPRAYCGFCGHEESAQRLLYRSVTQAICAECVVLCEDILQEPPERPLKHADLQKIRYCTFCGWTLRDAGRFVYGPCIGICPNCVAFCAEMNAALGGVEAH
ncbi:MAG: hypothetical protein JNJ73_20075 [Hyphomonadaceae bacterium]|nr:hypothetical protein [Hyphomonadaceae bacterium]